MTARFARPAPGLPTVVRFPAIERTALESGLAVWTIDAPAAPLVAALLIVDRGAAADPADRPGLAGLTADVMDEGAGDRDAIAIADAFMRLGTHLEIEVGSDVTTFGLTMLSRVLPDALRLVSDVILRPRFTTADIERIRELRLNRLRQISRSPGSAADRAFLSATFAGHPYGHGTLGTTASLEAMTADEVTAFWAQSMIPAGATLVVAGDVSHDRVTELAGEVFGGWRRASVGAPFVLPPVPADRPTSRVLLVDRPRASQSELRVGHGGPPRASADYHPLLTLNAVLGGQFSSRLNRSLREQRGVTYGVRTAFDMRRTGGSFGCDTSVQADATAESVAEILREFEAIREPGSLTADELELAKSSLTRGYVRNFETAVQLARAAAQMAVHGLRPDEFDRFVPEVDGLGPADLTAVARRHIHPDRCTVVVVGDRESCAPSLEALGRPVDVITPDF